jgi:hypothetical protein
MDNTRLNAGRIIFLRRGINFYNSRVDNNNRTNNNNTNNNQQNINQSSRNNLALRVNLLNFRGLTKITMTFSFKIVNRIVG